MGIIHTWPQELGIASMDVGISDGAIVTSCGTGKRISRTYQTRPRRTISGRLSIARRDGTDNARLERLEVFLHQVRGRLLAFRFAEPAGPVTVFRDLYCGLGDGTLTTFAIPVIGGSAGTEVVRVNEAVALTGYSVRAAANLLTDAQANLHLVPTGANPTSIEGYQLDETYANQAHVVADGLNAWEITPVAGTANSGLTQTKADMPAAAAGREYTGLVSVLGTGDFRVGLAWYKADLSLISTDVGTLTTASLSEWTHLSVTATAPAHTALAKVIGYRPTASANHFWLACFGLCPGDYTTWHLPSVSPSLLEFAAAPTDDYVVSCGITATQRLPLVRFARDFDPWTLLLHGGAAGGGFNLEEEL